MKVRMLKSITAPPGAGFQRLDVIECTTPEAKRTAQVWISVGVAELLEDASDIVPAATRASRRERAANRQPHETR